MERALNDILVIVWTCVWGEVVCNVADMCLSLLFQICAAAALLLLLLSSAPVAPKLEGSIFWRFSRENALVGTAVMSHISMKLIHYCASCLYVRWGSPPPVYVHGDVYGLNKYLINFCPSSYLLPDDNLRARRIHYSFLSIFCTLIRFMILIDKEATLFFINSVFLLKALVLLNES